MYSSRIHTARLLTYPGGDLPGGGGWGAGGLPKGVCIQEGGGGLPGGVCIQGGLPQPPRSAYRGSA